MNYFLTITSTPDYLLKFGSNNPQVDNNIDLGQFVDPAGLKGVLHYTDAANGDISLNTLLQYDAMGAVSGGIVISAKMGSLIEKYFPNQVQLLECDISYKGETVTGFYAINIYTRANCYNLEQSVYEVSPVNNLYDFDRIVLSDSPLEEYGVVYDIVRSVHDNKIVVSQTFKNLMDEHGINSLGFDREVDMDW